VSLRRGFLADLRRQFAEPTESAAARRVRFYAANLAIFAGVIGLVGFLPMTLGELSWAAAPGCVLMIAGGVLGIGVHAARDVAVSRRLTAAAAACAVIGFVAFFAAGSLTT
jgi:hypothetical protein